MLKRYSLGLWQEEQRQDEADDVDRGEEEELTWGISSDLDGGFSGTYDTTVRHVDDHERSGLRDGKVPKPLSGSGRHETPVSRAVVEDCRVTHRTAGLR